MVDLREWRGLNRRVSAPRLGIGGGVDEVVGAFSHRQGLSMTVADDLSGRLEDLVTGRRNDDLPAVRIARAAQKFNDKYAFSEDGTTIRFCDVGRNANVVAQSLFDTFGLAVGDRVAVMLPNCLQFPLITFANLMAGLVQVSINPNYTSAELLYQLKDSGASLLVIHSVCLTVFETIENQLRDVELVVVGDSSQTKRGVDFDLLCEDRGLPPLERSPNKDDLAFLQYTGGTTGVSKGAMITHGNLGANLLQFEHHLGGRFEYGSGTIFTALPMYHIFALMVNCLSGFCFGLTNHLVRDPRNVDKMVATLAHARPRIVTGVNTLFAGLAAHPDISGVEWSELCLSLGGGTKILPAVSRRWEDLTGQPIKVGYGLSETSPIVSIHAMDQVEFADHAGQAVLATEIKLLDQHGQEADTGQPGEVCVRGPQVMQGYWGRSAERAESFTDDGFFRTGDVAIRDGEGNLDIVDRIKDMILISGFNVYPNEIEAALAEHPEVVESICVGVPHAKTGETVKAFIVAKDAPPSERELTDFLRSRLTAYKVPRQYEFRSVLPKSAVGKLLRKDLKPRTETPAGPKLTHSDV